MADDQNFYPAVTGFRMSVAPDQPDLMLFEIKTLDAGMVRLSMTKESAVLFGQEIGKAVAK